MNRFGLTGVSFTRLAEMDISDAFSWYDAQSYGAGEAFLRTVDSATSFIVDHPEASPVVYKRGARAFVMSVFPYSVFYVMRRTRPWVFAVMHHRRNPRDWQERLK